MGEPLPQPIPPRVEQFPGDHYSPIIPGIGLEETYIDAAQTEFNLLRTEVGIDVPDVTFEVTDASPDTANITVTTADIEAERFTPGWEWPTQGAEAPHQDEAVELAEKLLDYYERVLLQERDWFLGAIATAESHGVTPDGRLVLLNTVPLVIGGPGVAGMFGRSNIRVQVALVNEWVRNIRFTTDPNREVALRDRLRTLMDRLAKF